MQYGVCNLSIVPLRVEPSDSAEMVNQLLFGETYEVLEKQKKWSRIRLSHDKYEGWIDNKQKVLVNKEFYDQCLSKDTFCSSELVDIISEKETGSFITIVLGSFVPQFNEAEKSAQIETTSYGFEGAVCTGQESRERMIEFAHQYLNAPYLWGGRTPFGIDCSGFTQMVYRLAGYQLPRDAYQQAEHGHTLSFIEESEPGDLAFFDNHEGKIVHVGIILENNYILHASGKVRLDRLDQTGIFNKEERTHTHKLRVIKKII